VITTIFYYAHFTIMEIDSVGWAAQINPRDVAQERADGLYDRLPSIEEPSRE
jgi:hypothetical protein